MVSPFFKQLWVASGAIINMLGQSMVNSYSSCLLPGLRHPDSPIKIDLETASWLASSMGFSKLLGFPLASILMQCFGRPKAYAIMTVPGIIGWVLIFLAPDVTTLMIGRIIGGVSVSSCGALGFIIIAEYSSPEHRGMFLNVKATAAVTSGLLVHIFGQFFTWRVVALIGMVPMVISMLMSLTWPESPSWLITKNRFNDFERNFYSLRGETVTSVKECEAMAQAQQSRLGEAKKTFRKEVVDFLSVFKDKLFIKPVLILVISFIVIEACGKHVYPAFALDIISSINHDKSQTFYFTIALDLINVISTGLSCLLIRVVKVRLLLFSSGILSLIVILSLSVYLFLVSYGIVYSLTPFLPLFMLALYFVIVNVACIPVCLILLGELIPLRYRSHGLIVVGLIDALTFSLAIKMSPILLDKVEIQGMFVVSAGVMALALLYLYFTVPETKGRSL